MPQSSLGAIAAPQRGAASDKIWDITLAVLYAAAFLISLSVWFLAIRAPLWTDETLSYWQTAAGFGQIWTRSIQGNSFAAYAYILWLTRIMWGQAELVLRIPSITAMLVATYVLYRCARQLFTRDVAAIAAILFILPRGIAFAAIDVRPYAFALLVTNLTILAYLRWVKERRIRDAAMLGLAAASIFYFHYLFSSILIALVVHYAVTRRSLIVSDLRQIAIALLCFTLVVLPVVPRLKYLFATRIAHSFAEAPQWTSVPQVLNPGKWQILIFAGALVVAALGHRLLRPDREALNKLLLFAILALVPVLCLYTISTNSSAHIFIPRYLLVAIPGMALFWGWVCSLIDSRLLRGIFSLAFVSVCIFQAYNSPISRSHEDSWKLSLQAANASTADDHAPILMCSPLVEADFLPMPAVPADSVLYSPLSYYKVDSPVIPLPRSLNDESRRLVRGFLLRTSLAPTRFLVLAPVPSLGIVDYLALSSEGMYSTRVLASYDDIWVVEFSPRQQ